MRSLARKREVCESSHLTDKKINYIYILRAKRGKTLNLRANQRKSARKGGARVTKQQKKDVRKGLRRYGRAMEAAEDTPDELTQAWGRVIGKALDYYAEADPVCAGILVRRYMAGEKEWDVVEALHIGRTTYYRKELEALSTVGLFAAREGLV